MGAALKPYPRPSPPSHLLKMTLPVRHRQPLTAAVLLTLALVLSACRGVPLPPDTPTAAPPTPVTNGELPFTIYLTDPYASDARQQRHGPDEALVAALDQANQSIDMAMLNLNLQSVTTALLHAYQRGLRVRIVTDSSTLDGAAFRQLAEAGIPILGDRREGLMHHKFILLDGKEVWTGSLNLTDSGTYQDHNNLVRLRSARIAQDYQTEFDEMFTDDLFGPDSLANTPYPQVTLNGRTVEIYFSPDDGVLDHLLAQVDNASQSIHFLAFSFTQDALADALIDHAQNGVEVLGVMDAEQYQSNQGGDYDRLRRAGLDVRLDRLPGQMHHKVIILDQQTVVFGSYNFSNSAETRNDENVVIVHDAAFAQTFEAEFERIFAQSGD